jgi:hypothetical protein
MSKSCLIASKGAVQGGEFFILKRPSLISPFCNYKKRDKEFRRETGSCRATGVIFNKIKNPISC